MTEISFANEISVTKHEVTGNRGGRTFSEAAFLTHLDLENNFKSPTFEITIKTH